MIDKSIYYDNSKLLSYNCILSIVIGERGVGKSYSFKKFCINQFKKKKRKFAWIRRYGSDLGEAIGTEEEPKFFKGMDREFPNDEFLVKNGDKDKVKNLYMNNRIIGYGMSLKSAETLKGTEYNDVDTIIVDEFLVGDGGSRYLKDEPMYLMSLIESISRLRKVRVILLGNATSIVNPYFDFFNLHLPYNSEFQVFKNNTIVVQYIKNEKYRKAKKESEFGKLVAGTKYENYAIDNQFVNDSNTFIKKKTNRSKLFCNIILNNQIYGVWADKYEMYISKKYNANYGINITYDYKSHNENTILMKSKNVFMQNIISHYKIGNLYFENQNIKHAMLDLFKKGRLIY